MVANYLFHLEGDTVEAAELPPSPRSSPSRSCSPGSIFGPTRSFVQYV
uniref:Uncharacterized protein n=1 Tax=Arundo donax TaxID=35708 RepID=A0A0A8ZAQ8_ARUDO